jgi:hypothetical protein
MTHLTSCVLSGKNIVFMLPDSNLIRPGCGATAHCKSPVDRSFLCDLDLIIVQLLCF